MDGPGHGHVGQVDLLDHDPSVRRRQGHVLEVLPQPDRLPLPALGPMDRRDREVRTAVVFPDVLLQAPAEPRDLVPVSFHEPHVAPIGGGRPRVEPDEVFQLRPAPEDRKLRMAGRPTPPQPIGRLHGLRQLPDRPREGRRPARPLIDGQDLLDGPHVGPGQDRPGRPNRPDPGGPRRMPLDDPGLPLKGLQDAGGQVCQDRVSGKAGQSARRSIALTAPRQA